MKKIILFPIILFVSISAFTQNFSKTYFLKPDFLKNRIWKQNLKAQIIIKRDQNLELLNLKILFLLKFSIFI